MWNIKYGCVALSILGKAQCKGSKRSHIPTLTFEPIMGFVFGPLGMALGPRFSFGYQLVYISIMLNAHVGGSCWYRPPLVFWWNIGCRGSTSIAYNNLTHGMERCFVTQRLKHFFYDIQPGVLAI